MNKRKVRDDKYFKDIFMKLYAQFHKNIFLFGIYQTCNISCTFFGNISFVHVSKQCEIKEWFMVQYLTSVTFHMF